MTTSQTELPVRLSSRDQQAFILATLTWPPVVATGQGVPTNIYESVLGADWHNEITKLEEFGIAFREDAGKLELVSSLSFSYEQSIPPEIRFNEEFAKAWDYFLKESSMDEPEQALVPEGLMVVSSTVPPQPAVLEGAAIPSDLVLAPHGERSYAVPCLQCSPAPCMVYPEKIDVLGGQDRFAFRVCPADAIQLDNYKVIIAPDRCVGCMLCALRCPISVIRYESELARKMEYNRVDDRAAADAVATAGDALRIERFPETERNDRTERNLAIFKEIPTLKRGSAFDSIRQSRKEILEVFLRKTAGWYKDQHYTWVRNCFRAMGMEATYSGSGGMLRRSDVSVLSPFIIGTEAKSPTENRGSISTGGVRQAIDARIQLAQSVRLPAGELSGALCVGRRITAHGVRGAEAYKREGMRVLLLSDAMLEYITLLCFEMAFSVEDLRELFLGNSGKFTSENLIAWLGSYFQRRIDVIREYQMQVLADGDPVEIGMLTASADNLRHMPYDVEQFITFSGNIPDTIEINRTSQTIERLGSIYASLEAEVRDIAGNTELFSDEGYFG